MRPVHSYEVHSYEALVSTNTRAKGTAMAIKFRYLGWTAFEITMNDGFRLIMDPMLQGRPSEDVPPSPIGIEEFDNVDLVMVSHVAADHVGQAFDIMKRSKAKLVCDMSTQLRRWLQASRLSGSSLWCLGFALISATST